MLEQIRVKTTNVEHEADEATYRATYGKGTVGQIYNAVNEYTFFAINVRVLDSQIFEVVIDRINKI